MKNKSRNLERFVGINLTSAMEEVLHDNDHEKNMKNILLLQKNFKKNHLKIFKQL